MGRRHFDAQFKQRVARMVAYDGLSVAEMCSNMTMGETAVWRWISQVRSEQLSEPGDGQPLTAEQRRIASWSRTTVGCGRTRSWSACFARELK